MSFKLNLAVVAALLAIHSVAYAQPGGVGSGISGVAPFLAACPKHKQCTSGSDCCPGEFCHVCPGGACTRQAGTCVSVAERNTACPPPALSQSKYCGPFCPQNKACNSQSDCCHNQICFPCPACPGSFHSQGRCVNRNILGARAPVCPPCSPHGLRNPGHLGINNPFDFLKPTIPHQVKPHIGNPHLGNPVIGNPLFGNSHLGQPPLVNLNVGKPIHGNPHLGKPIHGNPHLGKPIHGNPHLGQPIHGNPHLGQPVHGNPHLGQPIHGNPHAGQRPFGVPHRGQSPFGTPHVGQPHFGNPHLGGGHLGTPLFGASPFDFHNPGINPLG